MEGRDPFDRTVAEGFGSRDRRRIAAPQRARAQAARQTRANAPSRRRAAEAGHATPPLATLGRKTKKRIARGAHVIDGRLDLHGMTQAEAHDALFGFLRAKQARGSKVVLVITGKGARGGDSSGRGVLNRMVPLWLRLPDFAASSWLRERRYKPRRRRRAVCEFAESAGGLNHSAACAVTCWRNCGITSWARSRMPSRFPGFVRAAPVEADLQQRAERADAFAQRHELVEHGARRAVDDAFVHDDVRRAFVIGHVGPGLIMDRRFAVASAVRI